jgi:hypothetical protein
MNYQISDILSNPSHINDVPEEVLQNWINKYPFVPLLHLYALKKKENYSDTDLHRTAFHLINREKLYYLLKSKTATPREFEVAKTVSSVDETTPIQLVETAAQELVAEEITPISEILISDTTTAISLPQIEETTESNEINSKEEKENILKIEENTPSVATEEKPLSLADKILLEIQQIKAERAKQAEAKAAEPIVLNPEISEEKITSATEHIPEEKIEIIAQNKTEIPNIIIERTEKETEEKIAETPPTLSIQEEVIARIRKIQAEREQQQTTELTASLPTITEVTLDNENKEIEKEEILQTPIVEETTQNSAILEEQSHVVEHLVEEQKPLTIQEEVIARIRKIQEEREQQSVIENTPSVPEQVSTPPVLIEESNIEIPVENKNTTIEHIEIKQVSIPEIQIVENSNRDTISPIPTEDERTKPPIEIQSNKDIELVETKTAETAITVPEQETKDDKKQDENIPALSEFVVEKTIIENETFGEIFPEPLLVQISAPDSVSTPRTVYIEPEKTEQRASLQDEIKEIKQEITIPIANEKIEEAQQQIETLPEEYPTEVLENTSKISLKDKVFIPEVEEDRIEEHTDNIITSDKEIPLAIHHELSIDDQINAKEISTEAKNEPHTFIEWLKLLDGNLQIQTTEPTKEPENWIEIPRYEVEQTLAQKKQIQQEEQKLFEPNFEEGEVDLFNEIDEEVSKVATDSIQFKQDMMTETLAKIYQKQGKYDKALEIYNTLRLKFPEKNAYFAALIEKLEKEK